MKHWTPKQRIAECRVKIMHLRDGLRIASGVNDRLAEKYREWITIEEGKIAAIEEGTADTC